MFASAPPSQTASVAPPPPTQPAQTTRCTREVRLVYFLFRRAARAQLSCTPPASPGSHCRNSRHLVLLSRFSALALRPPLSVNLGGSPARACACTGRWRASWLAKGRTPASARGRLKRCFDQKHFRMVSYSCKSSLDLWPSLSMVLRLGLRCA